MAWIYILEDCFIDYSFDPFPIGHKDKNSGGLLGGPTVKISFCGLVTVDLTRVGHSTRVRAIARVHE